MSRSGDPERAQKDGRAVQLKPKSFEGLSKAWVVIEDERIWNLQTDESVALAGAYADVDSAGQLKKRITASRLHITGALALGLRKEKNSREVFLAVQGRDGSFLGELDPKRQADARRFALTVNTESAQLAASETAGDPTPPSEAPPAQHEAVEQIRRLAGLRDRGLITDEELEARTSEIRDRL